MELTLLRLTLAVCRLDADSEFPEWARKGPFLSLTRTGDELSVVCPQDAVPAGIRNEAGWRALRLKGPIDFSAIGVLASLTAPLAGAGISLFALSTFDTDYVLVREADVQRAIVALRAEGHQVHMEQYPGLS